MASHLPCDHAGDEDGKWRLTNPYRRAFQFDEPRDDAAVDLAGQRMAVTTRRGLAERADDFSVSGLRERLQRLRAHKAEAPQLQDVTDHDGRPELRRFRQSRTRPSPCKTASSRRPYRPIVSWRRRADVASPWQP